MNVKKMTCDELHETVTDLRCKQRNEGLWPAEVHYLHACEKELKRRWGISQ